MLDRLTGSTSLRSLMSWHPSTRVALVDGNAELFRRALAAYYFCNEGWDLVTQLTALQSLTVRPPYVGLPAALTLPRLDTLCVGDLYNPVPPVETLALAIKLLHACGAVRVMEVLLCGDEAGVTGQLVQLTEELIALSAYVGVKDLIVETRYLPVKNVLSIPQAVTLGWLQFHLEES